MALDLLDTVDGGGGPILDYHEPGTDWRSEVALKLSCMLSGAVVFAVVTITLFVGSIYFRAPDLLGLYPLAFVAAVLATVSEGRWTRCVGIGAVAGSVLTSVLGYTACLFLVIHPVP